MEGFGQVTPVIVAGNYYGDPRRRLPWEIIGSFSVLDKGFFKGASHRLSGRAFENKAGCIEMTISVKRGDFKIG